MLDPLNVSLRLATSGIEVQSARVRVASENVANAESTGASPGANPYTRKTITFENIVSRADGASMPRVRSVALDLQTPFRIEYAPEHPAADSKGFVKHPNVDVLMELADLREANRSYQANLQAYRQARELVNMTLDLMKG